MSIEIKEVITKKDLNNFINFFYKLYKGNQYACHFLRFDEMNTLTSKNPALEFCELKMWLAYKEGKIVGRIAGIINPKAIEKWGLNYARFGWLDFIDDLEVSKALFDTLEKWAKSIGKVGIHGPLGFTDLDREGMLIEGFEELSTYATYYNYPYYPEHMEKLGYAKDPQAEWLQYKINIPDKTPERLDSFAKIATERFHVKPLMAKNKKELLPYTSQMFELINQAFENLYGTSELNEKQTKYYVDAYFGFVNPEYISFLVDDKDQLVGFGFGIPSLTKAAQKAKGSLFPFGWYHLLRALKKPVILDLYMIGMKPEFHNKGIHTLIFKQLVEATVRDGIKIAVTNPQLSTNSHVLSLWKFFDARVHIKRCCFIKLLN